MKTKKELVSSKKLIVLLAFMSVFCLIKAHAFADIYTVPIMSGNNGSYTYYAPTGHKIIGIHAKGTGQITASSIKTAFDGWDNSTQYTKIGQGNPLDIKDISIDGIYLYIDRPIYAGGTVYDINQGVIIIEKTSTVSVGPTETQVKQWVKNAIDESNTISTINSNASTAATNSVTAVSNAVIAATNASNAVTAANNAKSVADTIYIATNETRNALRKKAIKVVAGANILEITYDEFSGTKYYNTTSDIWVDTAPTPMGSNIKAKAATGLGYTVLSGTINEPGVKVLVFGSRGIIFNVVAKPTLSQTATVIFQ